MIKRFIYNWAIGYITGSVIFTAFGINLLSFFIALIISLYLMSVLNPLEQPQIQSAKDTEIDDISKKSNKTKKEAPWKKKKQQYFFADAMMKLK